MFHFDMGFTNIHISILLDSYLTILQMHIKQYVRYGGCFFLFNLSKQK